MPCTATAALPTATGSPNCVCGEELHYYTLSRATAEQVSQYTTRTHETTLLPFLQSVREKTKGVRFFGFIASVYENALCICIVQRDVVSLPLAKMSGSTGYTTIRRTVCGKILRIICLAVAECLTASACLFAQNDSITLTPSRLSYTYNEDSTITFTYIDSTARKVRLIGSCMLPHEDLSFAGKRMKRHMHEVRPGVWECTTLRPLTPDMYTYQLIVDGNYRTDPSNPDSIWVRNQRRSVLLVAGSEQSNLYLPCKQQGQIEAVNFVADDGTTFRLSVYLPYNYQDTLTYPLLFLLHGINGDQRSWVQQGRIGNILDNLIQQQAIHPLVAVMPRCVLSEPKHPERTESTNLCNYGEVVRGQFEQRFCEIEQYVYQHYAVRQSGNGIAGLSCGARQAANIANINPSAYAYVGMFSPVVTHKQLPVHVNDSTDMPRYWVGGGINDWLFLSDARGYVRRLKKLGVDYVYLEQKGGHTYSNWRVFVTYFLKWAFGTIPESIACSDNP